MRSFAHELATIAGWHDGNAINVTMRTAEDDDVIHHEAQHARIFHSTPDGNLLQICILFAEKPEDEGVKRYNREYVSQHIRRAKLAHEASATFIGVEMGKTDADRSAAYDRLTPEYKDYYAVFDEIISSLAKSSFMRVAIAHSITGLLFSSRTQLEWVAQDFDYSALLFDPPDARLEKFQHWWSHEGNSLTVTWLSKQIKSNPEFYQISQNGLGSDTVLGGLDDDNILKGSQDFGRKLDLWVIHSLYKFFIENCPLSSLLSASDEFYEAAKKVKVFLDRFGVNTRILSAGNDDNEKFMIEAELIEMMHSNSNVVLHNVPHRKVKADKPIARLDQNGLQGIFDDEDRAISFVFDREGIFNSWCDVDVFKISSREGSDGGGTEVTANFEMHGVSNPKEAASFIGANMVDVYFGAPKSYVACILVPYENPDDGLNYSVLKPLLYTHPALPKRNEPNELSRLQPVQIFKDIYVEYVTGSFFDFLQNNRETHEFGLQPMQFSESVRYVVLWARQEMPPRYKIKVVPYKFGISIATYFGYEANAGRLKFCTDKADAPISHAVRLASSYWSQL